MLNSFSPSFLRNMEISNPPHPQHQDPISLKPQLPADDPHLDLYTIPSRSSWFSWNDIHDTERLHLREFFDGASITRTPKIYRDYRDFIISKYREDPSRRLTFTEVRKSLVGDVCLLRKVFLFLEKWGLINFGHAPAAAAAGEGDSGRSKVRVEEGAPSGVRVVAGPNSLKPVGVPKGSGGVGGKGGEVVGINGFRVLPPLASCRDVYSEEKGALCRICKERCENGHYECTKEGSFVICVKCHKNGYYGENNTAGHFKFIDCFQNSENYEVVWTEAETLLLLESVLKHGDDWDIVADNVKTKTKADCIAKLIQLPFGDLMLGSAHRSGGLWENDGNLSIVKLGQVASSESHSEKNVKSEDQCKDVKIESNQNGDAENQVPPLKKKRTTPPSDTGKSLMQQVALLSSTVDPHITASAAEAAVTALCDEYQCTRELFDDNDNEIEELGSSPQNNMKERALQVDSSEMEGKPTESESQGTSAVKNGIPLTFQMRAATATALGAAAARAKLLADQEDREIECLVATIIETQMKKLQRKIKHFDELELLMEKEHTQLVDLKESLIAEQMNVLQRVFSSGLSKWRDHASVKPQLDSVL